MGAGNSTESSQKGKADDIKLDKLCGFLQGIIADAVVTDKEFEALDDFKEREGIDEETYARALHKIGYTVKDVDDMRPSKNNLPDPEPPKTPAATNTDSDTAGSVKVENFVGFLRGILADDIVTDKELAAIHKYRAAESIDTAMYEKALAALGKTFNDMVSMKNSGDEQNAQKLNGLVQFLRGIIADDVVTDKEWTALEEYKAKEEIGEKTYQQALEKLGLKDVDDLKEDKDMVTKTASLRSHKTLTKVKLTRDGSLDKRSRAYKVLKEAGVDTDSLSIAIGKNKKRSRTEFDDELESDQSEVESYPSKPKCKKQRSNK